MEYIRVCYIRLNHINIRRPQSSIKGGRMKATLYRLKKYSLHKTKLLMKKKNVIIRTWKRPGQKKTLSYDEDLLRETENRWTT